MEQSSSAYRTSRYTLHSQKSQKTSQFTQYTKLSKIHNAYLKTWKAKAT